MYAIVALSVGLAAALPVPDPPTDWVFGRFQQQPLVGVQQQVDPLTGMQFCSNDRGCRANAGLANGCDPGQACMARQDRNDFGQTCVKYNCQNAQGQQIIGGGLPVNTMPVNLGQQFPAQVQPINQLPQQQAATGFTLPQGAPRTQFCLNECQMIFREGCACAQNEQCVRKPNFTVNNGCTCFDYSCQDRFGGFGDTNNVNQFASGTGTIVNGVQQIFPGGDGNNDNLPGNDSVVGSTNS